MSEHPQNDTGAFNFQAFQSEVSIYSGEQGLVWDIRDALFRVVANGRIGNHSKTRALPFLWLPLLIYTYITFWLNSRKSMVVPKPAGHHFFIPLPAENHFDRMAFIFRSTDSVRDRKIWYSRRITAEKLTADEKADASDITFAWVKSFHISDVYHAFKVARSLRRISFVRDNRKHFNNLIIFLTKFNTARRFFRQQFDLSVPSEIYSTFEKSDLCKAFFFEAKVAGVKRRVFWLHGMAHESLQATLATEMWCMRSAEAAYMRTLIPLDCSAHHMPSPRVQRLMESAGVRDETSRRKLTSLNILVLGTGNDPVFTETMRIKDLSRLEQIQISLGDSVKWKFRPHPGAKERYKKAIAFADLKMEEFSANSVDEDLKWCDIIIAPYSSVALEAHEIGRIVFWSLSSDENLYGVSRLIDEGIGQRITPENARDLVNKHFPDFQSWVRSQASD